MANIAELDPDDSILEALKTPKLATASFKKSKNRTDQPFLPTLFADEDTPKTNGRKSLALEEPTTAKREENLRYLHEINRTDRSRLNNTTRMNMSTTNYSMVGTFLFSLQLLFKPIGSANVSARGSSSNQKVR